MADVRQPLQSVFWPALTYFCHCDTHLNNVLLPPSAYIAVVRFLTTAAIVSDLSFNCISVAKVGKRRPKSKHGGGWLTSAILPNMNVLGQAGK